jgi:hypothetical protein
MNERHQNLYGADGGVSRAHINRTRETCAVTFTDASHGLDCAKRRQQRPIAQRGRTVDIQRMSENEGGAPYGQHVHHLAFAGR